MGNVVFKDFSMEVKSAIDEKSQQFLKSAAFEVEAQAKRTTPNDFPQLKGSWASSVTDTEAQIGSPMQHALWNEFGTGEYAVHGDGRKGWWVYIEGQESSGYKSKSYASQAEAEDAAAYIRKRYGKPAVASNGRPPNHTLENAFASKRSAVERLAETILKGLG